MTVVANRAIGRSDRFQRRLSSQDGRAMAGTSRVNREVYARFCGRLEVKFLRPTRRLGTPRSAIDTVATVGIVFVGHGQTGRSGRGRLPIESRPQGQQRHPCTNATAVFSPSAETDPTQRDRHIQVIAEQGRMGWQRTSGYNARAGAEGTMSRYKRIIGDTLRSHSRPA